MILDKFWPLRLTMEFQAHPYELGETVDVFVVLNPRRDLLVQTARVELVCEEDYLETRSEVVLEDSYGMSLHRLDRRSRNLPHSAPLPVRKVPKEVTKRYRESYVHSSEVFFQKTKLYSNINSRYKVELEILPDAPLHAGPETNFTWTLLVKVLVDRARDIRYRHQISVKLD